MPPSRWLLAGVPIALAVGYLAPERRMEGVQLLAVYVVLALGFYFLPG